MSQRTSGKKRTITRKSLEHYFNYILNAAELQKYIMSLPNYDTLIEEEVFDDEELKRVSEPNVKGPKSKDAKKFLTTFITSLIDTNPKFVLPIKILLTNAKKPDMLIEMSKNSIYIPIKINFEGAFINLEKIQLTYEENNIMSFLKKDEKYTMMYYSSFNNLEISKYFHDHLDPVFNQSTELINYVAGTSTYSYMDIYTKCIELAGISKLVNIVFLIADISVRKSDPSPLIISKGFKKSKGSYGFVVFVNKTRTKIKYSHLLSLSRISKKTSKSQVGKFQIKFNLKPFNNKLLALLKFNSKKLLQDNVERDAEDTHIKKHETLKIQITDNSLLDGIEFILGPEKRRKTIRDNRILSNLMYKDESGKTIVMGEFRGPLKTDETDDSEKDCKIIWNDSGNTLLADLLEKL